MKKGFFSFVFYLVLTSNLFAGDTPDLSSLVPAIQQAETEASKYMDAAHKVDTLNGVNSGKKLHELGFITPEQLKRITLNVPPPVKQDEHWDDAIDYLANRCCPEGITGSNITIRIFH